MKNIAISVIGASVGIILSKILLITFPNIRKDNIVKFRKNRRKSKLVLYEAEVVVICIFCIFLVTSFAEKLTGKKMGGDIVISGVSQTEKKEEPKLGYDSIYYAEKDKYNRYDQYALLHPEFSIEDVVWRVNANLDQEFYDEDYVVYADAYTDEPFLINKFNRVRDDFKPTYLVNIEGQYLATPNTARAYQKMIDDMEEEGMRIYVVSSYRDVNYQKSVHNRYLNNESEEKVDTYSSRAGYSEHHTGRALDISQVQGNLDVFEGSEEADWIYENCYKYGFIVRYQPDVMDVTGYIFEPWHITYVGTVVSNIMHDENISTLEEYVVKYVDHRKE